MLPNIKWNGEGRRRGSRDKGEALSQAQAMVCPHLPQHVVLLHVVDLPRADFPFERIFKELPADVDQQGCERPVLLRAAERLVMAAGGGGPVSQDHPDYESCKREKSLRLICYSRTQLSSLRHNT